MISWNGLLAFMLTYCLWVAFVGNSFVMELAGLGVGFLVGVGVMYALSRLLR